ncbi:hypothetical protein [Kocuria sp. ICS0012]|uniref:hypothetical protein n=1 Tax=Kocuria sp. ICS0012 TaxID=1834155 RepID=UPI0007E9A0DB|nr:hypothetical protein [Kocuria sp. ICS0012]OBA51390.1 hypothetical protein A5728_00010 [Kocuria sp. ICS0012]
MYDLVMSLLPETWTAPADTLPAGAWYSSLFLMCAVSAIPLLVAWKIWWRIHRRWALYLGIAIFLGGCGVSLSARPVLAGIWQNLTAAANDLPSIQQLGSDAVIAIVGWGSGAVGALLVVFFL